MSDNVALDVCIGLFFIYLLYSLLATTIKEMFATIFTYRGKMLERGIEQMLDGVNYKYRWWDRVKNWLGSKYKGGLKSNRKLLLKKGLFANNVISHELYRRFAEKSNTDKPSYLAADTFSDILIDVLRKDTTNLILLKDINQYVDNDLKNYPGLQKILKIYIEQANGDLQKFKLLIENWYNDMMDRVSGWYKQQAYKILIYIGLVLAVVFNISTIEIVEKLSADKNAREALVQNATAYVKNHLDSAKTPAIKKENAAAISPATDSTDTTGNSKTNISPNVPKQKVPVLKNADSPIPADTDFAVLRSKIDSMKALYKSTIEENNTILGLGWGDYGFTAANIKWANDGKKEGCKPKPKNWFEKVGYILLETGKTPRKWLGFLITALAISLGAPFWFDLLNKFINLRVSGAKPTDKDSTPVSKTALLNQKPDPTAKG